MTLAIFSSSVQNYNLYATQTWCTQNFLSGLGYLQLTGGTMTGPLIFSNSKPLNTTYAGCRIGPFGDTGGKSAILGVKM